MTYVTSFDEIYNYAPADQKKIDELRRSNGPVSRFFHSKKFDFLAGMAISGGISTAARLGAVSAATSIGFAAIPTAILGGAAAGIAIGTYKFQKEYRKARRIEAEGGIGPEEFLSKEFFKSYSKQLLKSTALSTIGGGLSYGLVWAFGDKIAEIVNPYASKAVDLVKSFTNSFATPSALASNGPDVAKIAALPSNPSYALVQSPMPAVSEQTIEVDISKKIQPAAVVQPSVGAPKDLSALFDTEPSVRQSFTHNAYVPSADRFEPVITTRPMPVMASPVPETDYVLKPDAKGSAGFADVPMSPPEKTLAEKVSSLAEGRNLSSTGKKILSSALAGDAQGLKDLGHASANGLYGFAKNLAGAVDVTRAAAEIDPDGVAGKGARLNLAFWKYHGQGGFTANMKEAMAEIKALGKYGPAKEQLAEWSGQKIGAAKSAAKNAIETIDISKLKCEFLRSSTGETYVGKCKNVSQKLWEAAQNGTRLNFNLPR